MKFETARTLVRSAGAARRRAAGPGMLEALEPRRLLTAYTYQPVAEAFDLDRFVREVAPPEAGLEGFGARVAGLGDVDGDGADDFAVSAPGARGTGLSDPWTGPGGKVFVYSGRTAGLIRTLSDGAAGFGAALVNAGDADGDGVADLAVGSPMFAGGAGRVTIYSGADGAVVRAYDGAAAGDGLGWAVANVTDVNLDGVDDLIIGAPGAGAGDEPGAGRAYVYSSADGSLLWTFAGEAPGDRFGFAVAGGVDVPVLESANGDDGAKEFFVGAPGHDVEGTGPEAGRAYAIDGATGAVRFTFSGENAGDQFGHSVLMVGGSAINRDFLFRWVVGVPGFDAPHFDPVTFEQLGTFEDGGRIERFLARGFDDVNEPLLVGDDDGARFGTDAFFVGEVYTFFAEDDVQEYAVTAPGAAAPANRLRLFNGNVTNGITGFPGTPAEGVSWAAVAGDADGDGIRDFVVSFPPSGGANGSVRIVPFTLVTEPPSIRAASDSGRYIVLASTSGAEGAATPGYVVIDGRLTSLPSFAGLLPGDQILAVNDEGLFFGLGALETGAATAEHYFFLFNGVRTRLSDAVATVSGAAPSSLSFAGMNNTGDVIFNGVLPGPGGQAQSPYLFRGGVLRQLWNGVVGGINDSGVIVGTRDPRAEAFPFTGPIGTAVVMLADGTVLELAGLANATAISDRGEIAGTSIGRMLAVLRDGVLTEIPAPDLPQAAGDVVWSVKDIDETGRMAAVATWRISSPGRPPSVNPSREYLYEPSTGLRRLSDAVTGDPEQPFDFVQVGVTRITAGNRLLAPTAVLVPEGAAGPIDGSAAAGSPTSATVGGDGLYVTAVNQDGTAVVLRLTGTGWEGQELPGVPGPPAVVVRDVITYTDARDGRAYAVVLMGVDLAWFVQNESGVFERRGALPLDRGVQFTGPLTTFTSADGRVHIVGTLGSGGHVAMAFQTNLAAPDSIQNWNYVNLSLTHLEVQGIEAPSFAGPLTAYATRWGGMNIAGLDAAGDIRVIWWGPGLTYWRTNNLSEIAGTPALTGRLASMVTSWDGLTLTGVGADTGELWSTWWVPSFGDRWRADSLSGAAASDLEFDPDSITAYVTDWGGQNIAGRNAQTGEIAVYWWAPATDVWTAEAITVAGDVGVPVSTGPLLSLADGQSLNLFLRAADLTGQGGDILRLFWRAADNVWLFENLTHAVSAAGGA